jgi:aspartyl-tRNA(Asn)/glutamyl-tRNA(Gln) amidotransferase subunit A
MEANYTFSQIKDGLYSGKLTCTGIVDFYLNRINSHSSLNAFLEVYGDEAKEQAAAIDKKIAGGTAGRLAGMVLGLKDNICYRNHHVSASSKILKGFKSLYSATVVEKLLAEDAIIIGRFNCDEFAMGSSNENSAFGNVKNPLDETRVPGGSSGGSAAAVAAGLCTAALGSDTGGSIRQPASFCGVVGLKPTYGRVSRYGLIAYASSFDQIGPLTRDVEDAALILEVIAGKDHFDSTLSSKPVDKYVTAVNTKREEKLKIAVIKECIESEGLDPEIRETMLDVMQKIKDQGHTIELVSFPYLDLMVPVYYVLTTAEASSNLSRFGGILYGHRSKEITGIDSAFRKSRTEGFGPEVKRRIMLGTFVLSAGFYDAYYNKAQKVRRLLQNRTRQILESNHLILLPSTPKTAFVSGQISDPVTMYLEDIFTVQANLAGMPAISLPLGRHSNGLPFGIQLIADRFEESRMLSFSRNLEQLITY